MKKRLGFLLAVFILASFLYISLVSAAPLFGPPGFGLINNTDPFYSPYEYINFSIVTIVAGPDFAVGVAVNLTSINATACGGTGYLNLTNNSAVNVGVDPDGPGPSPNIVMWTGGCAVSTFFDYNIVDPVLIDEHNFTFVAKNVTGGANITRVLNPILLHNLDVPSMEDPTNCTRFGSKTTNMSLVNDFSDVNFVVQIEVNFTCQTLGIYNGTTPGKFEDVALMNLTSVNMSNPNIGVALADLEDAINVSIGSPKTFEPSRIWVNSSAFLALSPGTVTLYSLPFTSKPNVLNDSGYELQGVYWYPGGYSSAKGVSIGNLTFDISHFSGYNATDLVVPTITIVSPARFVNSTTIVMNALVNGTGTEPSYVSFADENGVLVFYNSTYSTGGFSCVNVSSDKETLNCTYSVTELNGDHLFNVTAYDYGGSAPGNYNAAVSNFTVDTINPQLRINSASGRLLASTSVLYNFTVNDTNLNYCNWTKDDVTFYLSVPGEVNSSADFAKSYIVSEGYHNWSVTCVDLAGNLNRSTVQNFTVDTVNPNASLISPSNGSITNITLQNFTVNLSDSGTGLANATLNIYNQSGAVYNQTTQALGGSLQKILGIPVTLLDGVFNWFYTAFDISGRGVTTINNTITVDTIYPGIGFGVGTDGPGGYAAKNNLTINLTFSDANLMTVIIRIYNSSGFFDASTSANAITGSWTWDRANCADGIYFFNGTVTDSAGNFNKTQTRNVTLDTTNPVVSYGTGTEADGSYFTRNSSVVNVTVSDTTYANVTVILYNSTLGIVNSTFSTATTFYLNYTNLAVGTYYFNATAIDLIGHIGSSATRTFTIDRTAPTLNSQSPDPSTTGAVISYTASEAVNISITTTAGINASSSSYSNSSSATLSGLTANTSYSYNITICDRARNCLTNGTFSFTTDATTDDGNDNGGSTGGGESYWITPYYPTDAQLKAGYTQSLGLKFRMRVKVGTGIHYVGVVGLTSTTATINVSSVPQQAVFNIGDIKKFDVTNDSYYDLSVKLNSIALSKANITVTSIHEQIPATAPAPVATPGTPEVPSGGEQVTNVTGGTGGQILNLPVIIWWVILAVIVIAIVVIILLVRKRKRKHSWDHLFKMY